MEKLFTFFLALQIFLIFIEIKAQNKKEEIAPSEITNLYSSCKISPKYTTGKDLNLYSLRAGPSYSPSADNLLVVKVPVINNNNTSKIGLGFQFNIKYAINKTTFTFINPTPNLD